MIGAVPVHVPASPVSTLPCCAVPEIVGSEVLAGWTMGATTAVAAEIALLEPFAFLAVTLKRIVLPTSPEVSSYVRLVAPEMALQLAPFELQRCQLFVKLIGVVQSQVP